jgi:hypothetical protein
MPIAIHDKTGVHHAWDPEREREFCFSSAVQRLA